MDCTLAMVSDNMKKLSTKLDNQVQANINSNSMLTVLWKNQYGNKLVDEVPISDISKFEFSKLKDQSLNSFKSQQLFSKVDSLEREVADLKAENKGLSHSLEQLNAKMDDQTNSTSNILLVQQQMMTSMMIHMNLPIPGEAQDILSDPKPKGEKGKEVILDKRRGVPAKQQKLKGKLTEETIKPIILPSVEVTSAQGQRSTVTTTFYPSTMPKDISAPQPTSNAKPIKATIITEAKLQEVANSNIYHDEAFLEFLKAIYNNAQEDARVYREKIKESIKYFTVAVRKIKDVHLREVIMVCKDNCLWHLAFQTLEKLKFSELSIIMDLIEKDGANNRRLFDDLKIDQHLRLPEVISKPRTIIFQSLSQDSSIEQLVIPSDLTRKNNAKINQVLQMLRAKRGVRTAEELEMIHTLQSFLIHGVIPESVKEKSKKKDGEDDDEEKTYERRSQTRRNKDGPSESSRSKYPKKSKGASDDKMDSKGGKETVKRIRSGIQQVKDIASSTLTTTQDSKSRVGTVSKDPPKSLSKTSEPELPQKKEGAIKGTSKRHFHKIIASGVLQWMKGKGMKLLPSDVALKANSPCSSKLPQVKHMKIKRVAKRIRITKRTGKLTNVIGINVPPLDEDYDEDALAFLRAQRIFEVKVKLDHLQIKYTDGRERIMKQGGWQHFDTYEQERINALLNFEEKEERLWKIEIARFMKMHSDYKENLKKLNEEKMSQKEKELAEMEERAKELRKKGLCRVKQNPYTVEYKNHYGGISKIRMEFIHSYVESALRTAAEDLKDSPLIEELIARDEILLAISEIKKNEEIRKKKVYDDFLEEQLKTETK
ncbi:hypothetical protein POM88_013755 [Heracleum sosnowskyi]|uniref:Uncharacterized protein n=1 Tax=Heracleum sosnowskyi TaxID=360622 RepID=A0AAD8N308_9APIA|nr:hypothetical protein POM88_013755 [Heracleum sosnowskyi]